VEWFPVELQGFFFWFGLVALSVIVLGGLINWRRNANSTDPAVILLQDILTTFIDGAYAALQNQLSQLSPEKQLEVVKELAHNLYSLLPASYVLQLGKTSISIPLKVLLSEELFTDICVAAYQKTYDELLALQQILTDKYNEWKRNGMPQIAAMPSKRLVAK